MAASAYDTHAIQTLTSALDDVLADVQRRRERPIDVAEKRNLTMSVTEYLLEAYDGGVRDRDDLKRLAIADVIAKHPVPRESL